MLRLNKILKFGALPKNTLIQSYLNSWSSIQMNRISKSKFCQSNQQQNTQIKFDEYMLQVDQTTGKVTQFYNTKTKENYNFTNKINEFNWEKPKITRNYYQEEQEKKQQQQQKEQQKQQQQQKEQQTKQAKKEEKQKNIFFLNEKIFEGEFPGWFVSQSLLVCTCLGIYFLWKISENSDGVEMQQFMQKYFTQYNTTALSNAQYPKELVNATLSGFSHQSFAHLACNMFILLVFARRIHQNLGTKKFWALYMGALLTGYYLNYFNVSLEPQNMKHDNMIRRLNILRGEEQGRINMRSDGCSDGVMALVSFSYCSLASRSFVFPQGLYYLALLVLPTYFLEDLSNYLYPKKDTLETHINKPHIGGFLYGIGFYLVNELRSKQLVRNFDSKRFGMMGIYLGLYVIFYWYLNEKEYGALERRSQYNLGKKYEMNLRYSDDDVKEIIKQIKEQDILHTNNLNRLKKLLYNMEKLQIKEGDRVFYEIYNIIKSVKRQEERNFIINLLVKKYRLSYLGKNEFVRKNEELKTNTDDVIQGVDIPNQKKKKFFFF